ncbi:hypothetical protein HDU93_006348 [Gonapodya sp. JEL0774]|nr:hypothetical protein HDU93_006348 [Gonapodya sp. JEL0774]
MYGATVYLPSERRIRAIGYGYSLSQANEIIGNALAVTSELADQLNGTVGGGDLDWTVPGQWMVGGHVSGDGLLASFGKAGPVYVSTNWAMSDGEKETIERVLNSTNIGWVPGTSASPRWMAVVTGVTWALAVLAMLAGFIVSMLVCVCLCVVDYAACCSGKKQNGAADDVELASSSQATAKPLVVIVTDTPPQYRDVDGDCKN